jgi:hypothetical protein
MKRNIAVVVVAVGLIAVLGMTKQSDSKQESTYCGATQEALKSWENLKIAMTRQAVQKDFVLDGGMQFPSNSTYVARNCEYIKVKIEFKHSTPNANVLAPEDTVTKVSPLFIAYPAKD